MLLDANHKSTRDGFGEALIKLGRENPDVVVLTANLKSSTRCSAFAEKFPGRFFDCGVAEQNMVGIAAGFALSGKIPFACSYAVFSPGLSWAQLRMACYSQANIKIIGSHAGIVSGADGASHQGLEDIALMRALPNMVVLTPCDFWEAKKATFAAAEHKGPVYIRLAREGSPFVTQKDTPFDIGKAKVIKKGKNATIIACGLLVAEALKAAELLFKENKTECEVINCSTIKPLDKMTILTSVKKTGLAVTVEDHQIYGGLGSAVSELLSEEMPMPVIKIGMPDVFGESGKPSELLSKYGMDSEGIFKKIKENI